MKFKRLELYTCKLEEELKFYTETLGFDLIGKSSKYLKSTFLK